MFVSRLLALAAKTKVSQQATPFRKASSRESCSGYTESCHVETSEGLAEQKLKNEYRSRGRRHAQAVAIGIARKKLSQADSFHETTDCWRLRVVNIGFSSWARGRRSAANRRASLGIFGVLLSARLR